jgi:hypothetical protein
MKIYRHEWAQRSSVEMSSGSGGWNCLPVPAVLLNSRQRCLGIKLTLTFGLGGWEKTVFWIRNYLYGSEARSGSFHQQAKKLRKTWISAV